MSEKPENYALTLRRREQKAFEEWLTQDTALDWKYLDGIRMEDGLMDYDCVDIKNKWSGWLAARTGQKSWDRP